MSDDAFCRDLERRYAPAPRVPRAPIVRTRPTHTITEKPWDDGSSLVAWIVWTSSCDNELACGGRCVLMHHHFGACECGGDDPGEPGSCPH